MSLSDAEITGRALRAMRQLKGMTQRELASGLGWADASLVSTYETGFKECPDKHLEEILGVLGFDRETLEDFRVKGGGVGHGATSGGPEVS